MVSYSLQGDLDILAAQSYRPGMSNTKYIDDYFWCFFLCWATAAASDCGEYKNVGDQVCEIRNNFEWPHSGCSTHHGPPIWIPVGHQFNMPALNQRSTVQTPGSIFVRMSYASLRIHNVHIISFQNANMQYGVYDLLPVWAKPIDDSVNGRWPTIPRIHAKARRKIQAFTDSG